MLQEAEARCSKDIPTLPVWTLARPFSGLLHSQAGSHLGAAGWLLESLELILAPGEIYITAWLGPPVPPIMVGGSWEVLTGWY